MDKKQDSAVLKEYFQHNSSTRYNTDTAITAAIKRQYPNLTLTSVPAWNCDLLSFASNGHATATPIQDASGDLPTEMKNKLYIPSYRQDGGGGMIATSYSFAKFMYKWRDYDFIIYFITGGIEPYEGVQNFYILSTDESRSSALIRAVGQWVSELHEEIWVFDGGFWSKNSELYHSVMKASWDNVIMDADLKKTIIDDHLSFFRSEDTYKSLKVPWKRGLIFHGPPGNGKTISVKAMMNMLYKQKTQVQTLYVRSLQSVSHLDHSAPNSCD